MSEEVLFQMDRFRRQALIEAQRFYMAQARKRLLSQFEGMEAEAEKESADWIEKYSQRFDPDRHDPGDFYERAEEVGIEFYGLLSEMKEQTYLSVVAGMFHEWEKKLRDWLVREMDHWYRGENAKQAIWKANFAQISELLECLGWKLESADVRDRLDACRLVVNVYKHGGGLSLESLCESYPEYLPDPLSGERAPLFGEFQADHTHLKVTDVQLTAFSDAIIEFWEAAPENVTQAQIADLPGWFEKAVEKDQK